jgi:hypothetical protein
MHVYGEKLLRSQNFSAPMSDNQVNTANVQKLPYLDDYICTYVPKRLNRKL